jgi:tetratricopeptide (TPR) repeat protein
MMARHRSGRCTAGWIAVGLVAALPVLGVASARAQDEGAAADGEAAATLDEEARERARGHFERGTQAFDVGDYGRAAEAFRAAYELTRHPDLLFNIYSASERNGDLEQAREALAEFLRRATMEPGRRTALEARLARLEARIAREQARVAEERARLAEEARQRGGTPAEEPEEPEEPEASGAAEVDAAAASSDAATAVDPDAADAAPAARPPGGDGGPAGPHPAAIASFVVAGVGLVSFGVFAALSEVEDQSLASTCGRDVPNLSCDDVTALEAFSATADASWITAAVAGTLGLVLLFALEDGGGEPAGASLRAAPWAAPGAAGLAAGGRF